LETFQQNGPKTEIFRSDIGPPTARAPRTRHSSTSVRRVYGYKARKGKLEFWSVARPIGGGGGGGGGDEAVCTAAEHVHQSDKQVLAHLLLHAAGRELLPHARKPLAQVPLHALNEREKGN
jgi:hypothetical protein